MISMVGDSVEGWLNSAAKRELLSEFLSYSVPVEIIKLHQDCRPGSCDWTWLVEAFIVDDRRDQEVWDRRNEIPFFDDLLGMSIYFGSRLDTLGHNDPLTHKVFARLAKAIAILSFHPCGFRFLEQHWKATDYWHHRPCDCGEIDDDALPGCNWTIADLPQLQAAKTSHYAPIEEDDRE